MRSNLYKGKQQNFVPRMQTNKGFDKSFYNVYFICKIHTTKLYNPLSNKLL